jgi:hypothetical protein
MSAVKKTLPRAKPLLSREAAEFVRKRRMASQQTIDTAKSSHGDLAEANREIYEDEITR